MEKKSIILCLLNKWKAGSCSNTTLVAFVTTHLDVTFITPTFTPARINYKIE